MVEWFNTLACIYMLPVSATCYDSISRQRHLDTQSKLRITISTNCLRLPRPGNIISWDENAYTAQRQFYTHNYKSHTAPKKVMHYMNVAVVCIANSKQSAVIEIQ
jgi:hypothetical protein